MATRAASIWRAVSQPHSVACRPYSPRLSVGAAVGLAAHAALHHLAVLRSRRLKHVLDLLALRWRGGATAAAPPAARGGLRCRPTADSTSPLHDPHLAADLAVGRLRLGEPVVDVGAERVQRHAALAVPLVARHLGAAEAAGAGDADALRAELLQRSAPPSSSRGGTRCGARAGCAMFSATSCASISAFRTSTTFR